MFAGKGVGSPLTSQLNAQQTAMTSQLNAQHISMTSQLNAQQISMTSQINAQQTAMTPTPHESIPSPHSAHLERTTNEQNYPHPRLQGGGLLFREPGTDDPDRGLAAILSEEHREFFGSDHFAGFASDGSVRGSVGSNQINSRLGGNGSVLSSALNLQESYRLGLSMLGLATTTTSQTTTTTTAMFDTASTCPASSLSTFGCGALPGATTLMSLFSGGPGGTSVPTFGGPGGTSVPTLGGPRFTSVHTFSGPGSTSVPTFGGSGVTAVPTFGGPGGTSVPTFGAHSLSSATSFVW